MSRSGYIDDCDDALAYGRWRAQVRNATRGRRGQDFLRDLLAALDEMPIKRLIANVLVVDGFSPLGFEPVIVGADDLVDKYGQVTAMGEVCALGALGKVRGIDMADLDPDDPEPVADAFGIANQLVREIVWHNDEGGCRNETPEERFKRMRHWVASQIVEVAALSVSMNQNSTSKKGE